MQENDSYLHIIGVFIFFYIFKNLCNGVKSGISIYLFVNLFLST